MHILGIETSCDETAAAIIHIGEKDGLIKPLSNVISSQVKLHAAWGGVVPNLAAREHLKNILPVIEESLKEAKIKKQDINLIAITNGPGLIPALLVGTSTVKTIAYLWQKPLLGIHHIEGHIYANFINKNINEIKFPLLCLVVSGGHTQLVLMKKHLDYTIIGETQDDAVGEAFDKVARILGLGYPGGPAVAAAATKSQKPPACPAGRKTKNQKRYKLPRPMMNSKNFNFSFSGLKTAVLYTVKKNPEILQDKKLIAELCAEFQQAAVDVLVAKTIRAAQLHQPKGILLAGGVSVNVELQKQLQQAVEENLKNTRFHRLDTQYSLDNAAMIATAAFFRHKKLANKKSLLSNWKNMPTDSNLKLAK